MASNKTEVLLLSANRYDVTNRETGEITRGTSARYLFSLDLLPFAEKDMKGYRVAKASLPYEAFDSLMEVPGIYEADTNISIGSDGTAKVVASNFVFKRAFKK